MIHSTWILKDSFCLLQFSGEGFDMDHHLFSAFLSALSSFTKETMKRELNTFVIEDMKFIFEKNKELYFIICADKNDNNILLHKKLIRIQAHFCHKHSDMVLNWKGEISQFKPFREKLKRILSFSIEGTLMYCENCEHIITDEFHTKEIDFHDFYFCCENCQEHFEELCSEFIGHSEHYELI